MAELIQAVVLGVVQGLTEFIPVSSSGHLVLVPYLAGWPKAGLAFDVALHGGTAAAVIVYFRSELAAMGKGLVGRGGPDGRLYRGLAVLVAVASIPVAVVGLLFEDTVAQIFESPLAASGFLVVTALLLWTGERLRDRRISRRRPVLAARTSDRRPRTWTGDWRGDASAAVLTDAPTLPVGDDAEDPAGRPLDDVGLRQALVVGVFQCAALLPGISRSGSTIAAGLATGLTREAATRFSFLLSLPALLGAFALSLGDLGEPGPYSGVAIVAGVVAAFVSGYAAIRFLVRLVASERLTGFARYCLFAAAVGVVAYQFLGPPSSV